MFRFVIILAILENADLTKTSSKEVRRQLENSFNCDLTHRKKEIDNLVMDYVESQDKESEDSESEEEEKPKRAPPKKSSSKKRKGSDSESDSASDHKPKKGSSKSKKSRKDSDSDAGKDADWKREKKPAAAKKAKGASKGKGTGFTRPYRLSTELASVVGAEEMARHEVVKKMWEIIKGRNLYDPNNKQFAICDEQLRTVIGVKRFRTFAMLKYLKPHFLD